jgi:hypothetical protein
MNYRKYQFYSLICMKAYIRDRIAVLTNDPMATTTTITTSSSTTTLSTCGWGMERDPAPATKAEEGEDGAGTRGHESRGK